MNAEERKKEPCKHGGDGYCLSCVKLPDYHHPCLLCRKWAVEVVEKWERESTFSTSEEVDKCWKDLIQRLKGERNGTT